MEMETYHHGTVVIQNSDSIRVDEQIDNSAVEDEDNTGIGRTYECSYCKRGFTNAQALGGHMNIHRKDKAKAKQNQQQPNYYSNYSSSSTISYNNNYNNHNHNNEGLSNYYTNYNHNHPSTLAQQMGIYGANYNFYQSYNYNNYPFNTTTSTNNNNNNNYTLSSQQSIYGTKEFSSGKTTNLFGMCEDDHHHHNHHHNHHLGVDLSLRTSNYSSSSMINHFHQNDQENNNEDKYGAIDLELRLGYDP